MTERETLEGLISETNRLINHSVTTSAPAFQAWYSKSERFLIKRFGQDSFEYKDFKGIRFNSLVIRSMSEEIRKCKDGLVTARLIFQDYLEEMTENNTPAKIVGLPNTFNKIFIVHGHDGELKHSVARIIERQGIEAIILSEQANGGLTIIEKFENYSDVDGAICLFTADDIGKAKTDSADNFRARQNVVLETGYFMGKLGRNRVVILADKGVEKPSDLSGVVYTSTANWQTDLMKELKEIGYPIDLNKLLD